MVRFIEGLHTQGVYLFTMRMHFLVQIFFEKLYISRCLLISPLTHEQGICCVAYRVQYTSQKWNLVNCFSAFVTNASDVFGILAHNVTIRHKLCEIFL